MYRTITFLFLCFSLGCAQQQSNSIAAEHVAAVDPSWNENAETPSTNSVPDYPEKGEVRRLLSRAADLESQGLFANALEVASQAVNLDPHSPQATELKAHLEELLRRSAHQRAG